MVCNILYTFALISTASIYVSYAIFTYFNFVSQLMLVLVFWQLGSKSDDEVEYEFLDVQDIEDEDKNLRRTRRLTVQACEFDDEAQL